MNRPRLYVTGPVLDAVREELKRSFEILDSAPGAQGLLVMAGGPVGEELLDAAGDALRVVANYGVGVDNIDLDAARRRGIVVANTPGVLTAAVAEHTIALLLALVRRVAEGDRFVRRREAWQWAPTFMLSSGLAGKTLGIVGFGRIGSEVARLAEAHGMDVIWTRRSGGVSLAELLQRADVVSLHCPLTPGTRHLIDADALAAMKRTALLVNTARGAIVDERALVDALRVGRIGGAALDVFEYEPDVPSELLALENVVLTPHIGSATAEAREAMGRLCVDALRAVLLEGRRPENAVD